MKNKNLKILQILPLTLLALVGCSDPGSSSEQGRYEPYYDKTQFRLKYEDEFEGDSLDLTKWEYMIGDGSQYGNPGWGNNEQQYYTDQNTTFEDGIMNIHIKREDMGGKRFTSTRIRSNEKMYTTYGRMEALISLPAEQGLWPAFWMLPEADTPYGVWASSGEIDIMEARGRIPDMTSGALHYGQAGVSTYRSSSNSLAEGDTIENWHWYCLEWYPDRFVWYVDDDQFMEIEKGPRSWWSEADFDSDTAPFDVDFHLLINCAVGGNFDGGVEPTDDFTEAIMKVDCVRIYEYIGEIEG